MYEQSRPTAGWAAAGVQPRCAAAVDDRIDNREHHHGARQHGRNDYLRVRYEPCAAPPAGAAVSLVLLGRAKDEIARECVLP